jgi:hypothetical protein
VSCQATMEFLSYPVIDFRESQPKSLYLFSHGKVTYLRSPGGSLTKGSGCPKKNFKRGETCPFGGARPNPEQGYEQQLIPL